MARARDSLRNLDPAEVPDMSKAPSQKQLGRLRRVGQDMLSCAAAIAQLEADLTEQQTRYRQITMETLPAIMDEVGVDKLGMPDARADLVLKPYYHASIKEEQREDAHAWLEESGHGDMIKATVTLTLPRDQYDRMVRLHAALQALEPEAQVALDRAVHWKTLTSFVKEQVEKGEVLPLDLLGATVGRVVTIKMREGEKSSGKTKRARR